MISQENGHSSQLKEHMEQFAFLQNNDSLIKIANFKL